MCGKCCELWCSCVYRRRLCTQMLQIRNVFLGQTMCCSWGNVDRPGDATNLVETCYLLGKNNCTRKQHTLKAVVKVSRNIELSVRVNCSHEAQNSYQISKSSNTNFDGSHQRFNFNFKLDRGPGKRHVRSQHENEVEVRIDPIISPVHCAIQKSLQPYSLYYYY